MRTAHDLIDASTFNGRFLFCQCGHFRWTAPWGEARATGEALYAVHLGLWEDAEAEFDEAEAR